MMKIKKESERIKDKWIIIYIYKLDILIEFNFH